MTVSNEVAIGAVAALVSSLITELRDCGVLTNDQATGIIRTAYAKHAGKSYEADAKTVYETMFANLKL